MSINTKSMRLDNSRSERRATPQRRNEILRAYPWLKKMFAGESECEIKILMVADGGIDFGEGQFGLSELINESLRPSSMPWANLCITTAHRGGADELVADIKNFRFDIAPSNAPYNVPFDIEHYSQVWLFGTKGQTDRQAALSKPELKVLSDFMEAGGGVFATGDHQDLGFALCAEVPRVRSMRKWFFPAEGPNHEPVAPDQDGPTRLDTLREGLDFGFQSSDQSDITPQEIRPQLFVDLTTRNGSSPHPLLAFEDTAVKVLPDHMHEGECIVPTDLERKFSFDDADEPKEEYPPLPEPHSTARVAPIVVAIATSAGGYLTDKAGVLPVKSRCFAVITAYDGHRVDRVVGDMHLGGVGRVVVDTSFHHFVNINLNGTGSPNPANKGLYDSLGNPTKDYEAIKKYYQNIVSWLEPAESRFSRAVNLLAALRYMSPLIEEIRPIENPTSNDFIRAGTFTHNAISEFFSPAEATQYMLDLAGALPDKTRSQLRAYVDPWLPPPLRANDASSLFFRSDMLVKTSLGVAMLAFAKHMPEDGYEAAQFVQKRKLKQADFNAVVKDGMNSANALFEIVNEWRNALDNLSAAFKQESGEAGSRDDEHVTSDDRRDVSTSPGKPFAEENTMPFDFKGRWETTDPTKPRIEFIHVGREDILGGFVGWHQHFGVPIRGIHTVDLALRKEFIRLIGETIEADGSLSTFTYEGEVTFVPGPPEKLVATGHYRQVNSAQPRLRQDDDWTAEKPLT